MPTASFWWRPRSGREEICRLPIALPCFSARISRDNENYIGANPLGTIAATSIAQARRDTVTAETASMIYTPISAITLTFAAGHATRDSNIPQFHYNDLQASVNVVYKFFRYGNPP